MKKIGVGVIGFGTVGAGVVEGLLKNGDKIAERVGVAVELRRVADLDITTDRGVEVPAGMLTTDADAVIGAPDIDIVVELVGGTGFARTVVRKALEAGQSVVTANKKLLAEYGGELFPLAVEKGVDLYFGASVGGGIPIIRALREGLSGNRVKSIFGILNGTCNYILTRMETENLSFDDALAAAQREGYAEANPTLDVDGFDTLHKAAILASLAFGFTPDVSALPVAGIRGTMAAEDIRFARELGYRIKLLAVVRDNEGGVEVRVAPTLVPLSGMLASVNGVFNAVKVDCDLADTTLYYGRGAGRRPTASTVIGDIADVAFNRANNAPLKVIVPKSAKPVEILPAGEVRCRHYLRLSVLDEVGTLADITAVLAKNNVSIASVLQKGATAPGATHVPVIVLTHTARQADIDAALAELAALPSVDGAPVRLGIEE